MKLKLLILNCSLLLPHFAFPASSIPHMPIAWKIINKNDFSKILVQLQSMYNLNSSFRMEITHSSFQDYTSVNPSDEIKGYLCIDAGKVRSKLLGILSIMTPEYKMVLDSASQVIILSDIEKNKTDMIQQVDVLGYLNPCNAIQYYVEKDITVYRMDFAEAFPYKYIDISIDHNGLLHKIDYFMNHAVNDTSNSNTHASKPRVTVRFENYLLSAVFPKNYFDEKQYVQLINGKMIPTVNYSNFKIIDFRNSHYSK